MVKGALYGARIRKRFAEEAKKKKAARTSKSGASKKGSPSKTHAGDLDYSTKRGDKVYHRAGKDVKGKDGKKPFQAKPKKQRRTRRKPAAASAARRAGGKAASRMAGKALRSAAKKGLKGAYGGGVGYNPY